MIEFLGRWQTLIGASVAGITGLLAALIVARDARRREERSAAMLVLADLTSVVAAGDRLKRTIDSEHIDSKDEPRWIAYQLSTARPILSGLLEPSLLRIMHIDKYMAAHLLLFKTLYYNVSDMSSSLGMAEEALNRSASNSPLKSTYLQHEIEQKIRLIHNNFFKACEHARCAQPLVDKFVLRPASVLYRFGRNIGIVKHDEACLELLRKG
jgi:hypothetical protein